MTEIKPIRNYPFRGKIYTAKQIDEIIEQSGQFDPDDYYDKTATDTLLATKQDVLTAGTGISIEENIITNTLPSGEWLYCDKDYIRNNLIDNDGHFIKEDIIICIVTGDGQGSDKRKPVIVGSNFIPKNTSTYSRFKIITMCENITSTYNNIIAVSTTLSFTSSSSNNITVDVFKNEIKNNNTYYTLSLNKVDVTISQLALITEPKNASYQGLGIIVLRKG